MRDVRRRMHSRRALLAVLPLFPALAWAAEEEVSDDALYDAVNRRLITDRELGTRPLEVRVDNGVVTVSGFVSSEKMRKRVDKVVKKEKGVKRIVNQTRIRTF